MTPEYEKWFADTFKRHLFTEEEFEELKTYCWLSWRDSRRELSSSVSDSF